MVTYKQYIYLDKAVNLLIMSREAYAEHQRYVELGKEWEPASVYMANQCREKAFKALCLHKRFARTYKETLKKLSNQTQ